MPTYPDGGSARHTDPSTSHEAANQDFRTLKWEVGEIVRLHGRGGQRTLCCVEIHALLGGNAVHPIDSISPRLKDLVRDGVLIRHPKEPRGNRYGNLKKQLVYSYNHLLTKGLF